jgi:hypothetical protein
VFKYGSHEAARTAAETYQREIYDRGHLTILRPSMDGFWETIRDIGVSATEERERHMFIAGFMDGDGCISLREDYQLFVGIGQSCNEKIPLVIQWLGALFEIQVYSSEYHHIRPNQRMMHRLVLRNGYTRPMLNIMLEHSIIKRDQAEKTLQFLNGEISARDAYEYLKRAKEKEVYQNVSIDRSKMTFPYIAGLFDAEGCVWARATVLCTNITQPQSPRILHLLTEIFPGGRVQDEAQVTWEAERATRFLSAIEPFTIHKRPRSYVV